MRGLLLKSLRETWLAALLFGLGLLAIERLLTFVLPQIQAEIGQIWLELPFARNVFTALLGIDVRDEFTGQMLQSLLWVHPVVLAAIWGHEVIHCTRVPAGEIDRGTIDVLLGFPVSRRAMFVAESAVWLASGLAIIAIGAIGYLHGSAAMDPALRPAAGRTLLVLLNLACLYVAVGGVTYLVSACCDRRGRAIGWVFGLLLASFLLNFLAQFWAPARKVAFLGVMNYYRPAIIIQDGVLPAGDLAVLLGVGVATWILAGEVTARRSICTT
jgi:ABC-type transport system involved in multi-copper enzyme maturation permease subunit